MLRVALTGGLGSGKSTAAQMFAERGLYVLSADSIGREMMQPGAPLYRAIVEYVSGQSGAPTIVLPGGQLDRAALARFVFSTGRVDELSRIVHPSVIAEQERRMDAIAARDADAIAMVESALIFEADRSGTYPGLRSRFDKLILITAPEVTRLARYIDRAAQGRILGPEEKAELEADGRRRMAAQIPDEEKIPFCDFVIDNSGTAESLEQHVESVYSALCRAARPEMPRGEIPGLELG